MKLTSHALRVSESAFPLWCESTSPLWRKNTSTLLAGKHLPSFGGKALPLLFGRRVVHGRQHYMVQPRHLQPYSASKQLAVLLGVPAAHYHALRGGEYDLGLCLQHQGTALPARYPPRPVRPRGAVLRLQEGLIRVLRIPHPRPQILGRSS